MPITPLASLTVTNVDSVTLTDSTVYGGANENRNELAVIARVYRVSQKLTKTPVSLTKNSPDPLVVSTFTYPYTDDGYTKFILLYVPVFDIGATYATNDVVYYNGVFYQSSASGNSGAIPPSGNWAVITEENVFAALDTATEPANVYKYEFSEVLYAYLAQKFGDYAAQAAIDCCTDCDRPARVLMYENLGVMLESVRIANQRSQYVSGERIVRKADQILSEC